MYKTIFAWDLGATKCSAGIVEYDTQTENLNCKKHYSIKLADANSLEDLVNKIEQALDLPMREADAICIGAAGHYNGVDLLLENGYAFSMHFAKLAEAQQWPPYSIIHDYAPIVCATFTSYMHDHKNVKYLNSRPLDTHGRRVALGVGTGLGVKDGVLLPNGDFWLGHNEMGHIGITLPPSAQDHHIKQHYEFMHFLQSTTPELLNQHPLTFEKILSGKGLTRLYQFFYPGDKPLTPEEVGAKVEAGLAEEMLHAFAWYLGLFVGSVQLSFMPTGGVWITGGVALNHIRLFDKEDFFAGIAASPAYQAQRQHYPLGVLQNSQHALMGCGYYAVRRLM